MGKDDNHLELLPVILDSIKKIARKYKHPQMTLQTTEVIHEGYINLMNEGSKQWQDKDQYIAAFAVAMRRYLIDRYRKKTTQKRGGAQRNVSLDELAIEFPAPDGFSDWLELDRMIEEIERVDPLVSQIIQLKYFVGLTTQEIAKIIKKDPRTVSRKWKFARAWIHNKLTQ